MKNDTENTTGSDCPAASCSPRREFIDSLGNSEMPAIVQVLEDNNADYIAWIEAKLLETRAEAEEFRDDMGRYITEVAYAEFSWENH